MSADYLKRILTSKVYDVAVESPLDAAPVLDALEHLFFKLAAIAPQNLIQIIP